MNRHHRNARGLLIKSDGLLTSEIREMPLATARRRVREWKFFYERYGYETAWNADGSAVIVRMPSWDLKLEAVPE